MTDALPGFNTLLMGPTGTGKTYAIGSLVDTGIETFYLALEAGMESLLGYWKDRGRPVPENLHWHHLAPASANLDQLITNAKAINTLTMQGLANMQDPERGKHNQFIELLKVLNDFTDQRTGESFGPVNEWDTTRALVIDPLTGINNAAMSLVIGGKPVKSQADWGIAQDQVEKVIRLLSNDCRCHFVLTAHIDREVDQVLGGTKITVSTLGQRLAPKIPPMFSDVILTVRDGTQFFWSTANTQCDLKTRNLPLADKIPPDFGKIVDKWKSRNAQ